jgi:nitroreductase
VRQILVEEAGAVRVTDPMACIQCGHCEAVCPEDAIRLGNLETREFSPVSGRSDLASPESLMALFRHRRSTRIFRDTAVEREKTERIIEAGRFAPTGGNLQPLRHVVVQTPEKLAQTRDLTIDFLAGEARKIEKAIAGEGTGSTSFSGRGAIQKAYAEILTRMAEANREGADRLFWNAPVLVVTHANPALSGSAEVDAGLAAMQMTLMAESLGLGTCFIGFVVIAAAESRELKTVLGIPAQNIALVDFVTGYPDVRYLRYVSRRPARVLWL